MTLKSLKTRASVLWRKFLSFLDMRPLVSFFGFLGLLLVVVAIGSFLRKPVVAPEQKAAEPTLVETYSFGESPKMKFTAKVEKAGVISLYAQTSGIVQKIQTTEGKRIGRGQALISLSSTYQGGNISSISRQIAQKNADSATNNFDLQMDMISRQRDIANKVDVQASDLRTISRNSIDDTQALIDLNQDILSSLDTQIANLTATNVNGSNDAAILGAKQGKAAVESGLLNLRAGLRNTQYQTGDSTVSAQLADVTRDLTLRQLDLQERGLTLAKDIAALNLKLAKVNESFMFPAAPCNGVVERINVKVGQNVSAGTLIATIKADQGESTAVVLVPREIAAQISKIDESEFKIGAKTVSVLPRFISTEATDGTLYSVLYTLPATSAADVTNATSVEVQIPMGSQKIVTDELYVPLDSVYQTQEKSYIYVVDKNEKISRIREISVGDVSGTFVKVTSGLSPNDVVIVSRNVQEGESIRTE